MIMIIIIIIIIIIIMMMMMMTPMMMIMMIIMIKIIFKMIIMRLIYIAQFDTNGILTALYTVIKYIQTQYMHIWTYMKQSCSYTYTCLHIYTNTVTSSLLHLSSSLADRWGTLEILHPVSPLLAVLGFP